MSIDEHMRSLARENAELRRLLAEDGHCEHDGGASLVALTAVALSSMAMTVLLLWIFL